MNKVIDWIIKKQIGNCKRYDVFKYVRKEKEPIISYDWWGDPEKAKKQYSEYQEKNRKKIDRKMKIQNIFPYLFRTRRTLWFSYLTGLTIYRYSSKKYPNGKEYTIPFLPHELMQTLDDRRYLLLYEIEEGIDFDND